MKRIFVVEDEPGIAFGLKVDFEAEGYEVETEADGQAALERARREIFDLILLDVMLPRKDGFEICRELRRDGLKMPIVLLTARAQEAEKVMGLESGADDYITKPFSPRELRARVKAALRRTQDSGAPLFRFGDAEVDLDRCELRRDGVPVELTALEFKLLAVFAANRGKTLSRDRLLDLVWGRCAAVTLRVVDNHIVELRKKVEPEPSNPRFLRSIRGLGYRFDA
ncbi:MAG: response regulator transcription factor [Bryobacteraceae bacterium]|jgi:two-component system alkaline phosphatase synthesis response regulator PhoP